jgi:hypothetical protein
MKPNRELSADSTLDLKKFCIKHLQSNCENYEKLIDRIQEKLRNQRTFISHRSRQNKLWFRRFKRSHLDRNYVKRVEKELWDEALRRYGSWWLIISFLKNRAQNITRAGGVKTHQDEIVNKSECIK